MIERKTGFKEIKMKRKKRQRVTQKKTRKSVRNIENVKSFIVKE